MAQPLRIVNYAVNGTGAGHLTRLVAMNRWLRRYAAVLELRAEIYFLTTSEADGLLFHEQFASFKLPSKTIVGETGIDKLTYLALAKQWIWHSLSLIRPELLIVDTFPRGSFGELLSALDLCRHKAFIHRPVKEEFASRPDFQTMLPLYDLILVPEYAEHAAGVTRRSNLRFTGPVMVRERAELWSKAEVRAHVAALPDELVVYVSAGGGGDALAEEQLHRTCAALLGEPGVRIVVGAGPLYRGRPLLRERVLWLQQPAIAELMDGFDLAVCAAGYNSFYELMHAGVPTLFLPQEKVVDEQDRRAARACQAGAAFLLPGSASDNGLASALRPILAELRDPVARERARTAARSLAPTNHARDAAAELLRLLVPGHRVDRACEAIHDELLIALRADSVQFEQVVELMHALRPEPVGAGSGRAREELAAQASLDLLRLGRRQQIPQAVLLRAVRLLAPKLGAGTAAERASSAAAVLGALAQFADWPAALSFMKLLVAERRQRTPEAADELLRFLATLQRQGEDLLRGISYLSQAHGQHGAYASNRELLQAAQSHLQAAAKSSARPADAAHAAPPEEDSP
ncbi:MAG TPA: glycosyltransferase [Pseudomonadota bacterium]|nr:glycosyltransferase [Pseudomonadota bacterium]